MLKQRLEELRLKWEGTVQQYSDSRAIDHGRTITQQSINQAIKEMDINRALAEIGNAREAMLYTEEDLATLTETTVNEIIHDQTMNYARMLGDEGMLWLMNDEAGEKFAIDIEGQQFVLDQETRNDMAADLGTERSNRKKAEDAATWQSRKIMRDYAQEQIESGKLTNIEQLYDDEHQEEFINQHGFILDLNEEDKNSIRQLLADRATTFEKDRETYSDDMLEIVSDAIDEGDVETARRYLDELIDEGYAHDAMGRVDPEIRRYIEQYERIQAGGGLTEFDRDANALRTKLRAGTLTRTDLGAFLEKHPAKEGRVEHDKMWNELEQLRRERESEKNQKQTEETLDAEYDEHFYSVYDDPEVNLSQLEELDRWRYDNYPKNKKDPTLPGIEQSTWETYGRLIRSKKKELKAPEIQRRKSVVDDGEKKIMDWYAPKIKDEAELNPDEAARLRTERNNKVGEYHDLLEGKDIEDPGALADFLLFEPKRQNVKKSLRLFSGKRPETDIEYYTRLGLPEMIPREELAAAGAREYAAARRGDLEARIPEEGEGPIIVGAEEQLLNRFKNYRMDPQHGGLATSTVYNNRSADPGCVWVYNEALQRVEMVGLDEVLRFNQVNK